MNLGKNDLSVVAAEFFGTAILATSALALTSSTSVTYFVATSVAVTLGILVLVLGPVSGGHFNPAVTFGLWTARKIDTLKGIMYIAAQMLGAFAAWQLFEYLTNKELTGLDNGFSTEIWLAEAIGTFIFTMGIAAAITRGYEDLLKATTIGTSLFVGILAAALASAGILNPALALSLQSFDWAYILGPLLGAVLGFNFYIWLFAPSSKRTNKTKK